jgi:hypothetical protein
MPSDTLQFCKQSLIQAGIPLNSDGSLDYQLDSGFDNIPMHKIAYLCLQDILHDHLNAGKQLSISMPPRGAYKWIPQKFKVEYPWNNTMIQENSVAEVDINSYEGVEVYEEDGPHYIDWGDRYEDGGSSCSSTNSNCEDFE